MIKCHQKMVANGEKGKKGFLNGDVTPQLVTLQALMLMEVLRYKCYVINKKS